MKMPFSGEVIDVISSSDSDECEIPEQYMPSAVKKSCHDLSPSSDSDGDVQPLYERLKLKVKAAGSLSSQDDVVADSYPRLKSNLRILELSRDEDDVKGFSKLTTMAPWTLPSQLSSVGEFSLINCQQSTVVDTLPDIFTADNGETESGTSSQLSAESQVSDKQNRFHAKLLEAQQRRADKTKQRENLKTEKERQKILKQINREQAKSCKPGECNKYVMANLDLRLLDLCEAVNISNVLSESNVRHSLLEQLVPCSVTWTRDIVKKSLAENCQVNENVQQIEEDQALILMSSEQFVKAVYSFSQKRKGFAVSDLTLREMFQQFKCLLPGKMITLITCGMQQYFRGQANKDKRAYRAKAINGGTEKPKTTSRKKQKTLEERFTVSRVEVEEALIELQFEETCNVHLWDSWSEVVQQIITFTKAIAEAPFRRDTARDGFISFVSSESGKPVKVDKDGRGLLLLWQRQIQQFNNVSADMAQAIVLEYPSPLSLFKAYQQCEDNQECERLLKDVVVRRGAGPLATTRKIGQELSHKIYLFMTSRDGDLILS